jgi:hypothetical protein
MRQPISHYLPSTKDELRGMEEEKRGRSICSPSTPPPPEYEKVHSQEA